MFDNVSLSAASDDVQGIAIDWVTKEFYFGDTTAGKLYKAGPSTAEEPKIYSNVGQVRDIVIDSYNGFDYIRTWVWLYPDLLYGYIHI